MKAWMGGVAALALTGCVSVEYAEEAGYAAPAEEGAQALRGAEALGATDRSLHDRVLTMDTHVDIGQGYATAALDPGGFTRAQVDLPKMRDGGLDAAFFIVYVGQGLISPIGYEEAAEEAEDKYQAIMRMIRGYRDQIALATTADDVEAIHESGRLVALIGMENSWPLGEDLDNVAMWAERGVRYVSITHFGNNQFGGSSNPNLAQGDPTEDPGERACDSEEYNVPHFPQPFVLRLDGALSIGRGSRGRQA